MPFSSPVTVCDAVSAVAPSTSVHPPQANGLATAPWRNCQPVIVPSYSGAVQSIRASPSPGVASACGAPGTAVDRLVTGRSPSRRTLPMSAAVHARPGFHV